jgi:hypothetical protein
VAEVNDQKAKENRVALNPDDPEPTLRIEINRDVEIERLQEQNKLLASQIAVQEFRDKEEKARQAGSPPQAPRGGDTAPLNSSYDYERYNNSGSLMDKRWDSENAMYSEISRVAKDPNHPQYEVAQQIERQLVTKIRKEGLDYEFYGDSHALYRQPKPITPDMTQECIEYTKRKNAELISEKTKWRKVN